MAVTSAPPSLIGRFAGPEFSGYALAIGGAVLFATKGIFAKLAYRHGVGTETVLALRMVVALPVYLAIFLLLLRSPEVRARLTARNVLTAMAVGLLGYYVSSYLDFAGLSLVSAQYERLVLFTYPFFVLLFGVWFFRDRMRWTVVPGMAVSYAGLLIIFGWNLAVEPDGLVAGTLLVLASAITFALYQHLAKRQISLVGSGAFTCIGMSTAGVVAIIQATVLNGPQSCYLVLPAEVWWYGLGLGVLGTVLPSFMTNGALRRIGPRATAATGAFGPIMTTVIAVLVLNEPFTLFHLVGTALVIIGSVLFGRAERKAKLAEAAAGATP